MHIFIFLGIFIKLPNLLVPCHKDFCVKVRLAMGHPSNLITVSEALQRVFLPNAKILPRVPSISHCKPLLCFTTSQRRHLLVHRGSTSNTPIDPQKYGPPEARDGPPRDESIRAYEVRVVSASGPLNPPERLSSVLASLNRKTQFLQQVSPPEQLGLPICKIFDRKAVREQERARAKKEKNADTMTKTLEMNWAIENGDLKHRLGRLEEFLKKGHRVEIWLAAKRKGRKASEAEVRDVMARIRVAVSDVDGKEWKPVEGKADAMGQVVMYFQPGKTSEVKRRHNDEKTNDSAASELPGVTNPS